jgi:hypothetical protein
MAVAAAAAALEDALEAIPERDARAARRTEEGHDDPLVGRIEPPRPSAPGRVGIFDARGQEPALFEPAHDHERRGRRHVTARPLADRVGHLHGVALAPQAQQHQKDLFFEFAEVGAAHRSS